jgi:serine/threonine protein kinase/Tfp pilus assembly protein PilF
MGCIGQAYKSTGRSSMTSLEAGSKLGPYEILAPLGAGGMGEVWKARDTRLGRVVAIKKVKEQHSERFKQEARTIAALNHPYICQIHDIGPDYLVLEYVEGKPLSSPLPEKEAVRLAIQIASALEAAHKKGIIHRDLKPGNIMVTDEGSVKLLDFGLAKLYEQAASSSQLPTAGYPATQAGAVLGTIAYMSPEQAQGQSADARSDIFSFGAVLYEILSGRRAFSGESNYAIMDAIVKQEPIQLQASFSLEKIVQRCLAKQPSVRYQTISEVKGALEDVFATKATAAVEEPQPSIAVLPFVNMSGDKEQEYFSDGLAEEIINALTKIPGLKVPARTSSFFFRGKEADIQEISARLHVKTILEGSVRKSGNRIRVTAQLINAADGYHLWSERYDREMTEVFAIQDEICQAIVGKLCIELSADRPLFFKRRTENTEAYNLYLKGRYQLLKFMSESMAKSKEYFEQAVALDPDYALAWHGLAMYHWFLGYRGFTPPNKANVKCRQATLKALELDEMLSEAHSMMAVLWASEYDWKGAESEFRRAMELGPKSVDVWQYYSRYYLLPMRRLDEAIATSKRAVELDPLSPDLQYELGHRYWLIRQYDRALGQADNALELNPQFPWAHMLRGVIYIETGRLDEGIQAVEVAASMVGHTTVLLRILGYTYAMAGRTSEAQKLLDEMLQLSQKTYMPPLGIAYAYLGLNEMDKAVEWLEKAIDERDGMVMYTPSFHLADPLRSHPHYHVLLRKMNLEV